jgi:hypothetical protein
VSLCGIFRFRHYPPRRPPKAPISFGVNSMRLKKLRLKHEFFRHWRKATSNCLKFELRGAEYNVVQGLEGF